VVRINFQEELNTAEGSLLAEGSLVRRQLERVLEALERRDPSIAESVVAEDDRVDDSYLATQSRVLNLLALQAPVASDLRLVAAILFSNMHLERMGDLCVNIAKFVLNGLPYPADSPMLLRLHDMGVHAKEMLDLALSAVSQRSVDLAEELPVKDDALDRLNRGMLDDMRQYAGDHDSFEWAVGLILVARYLERFGDHAVDIGEQVSYLATGVFREFTDASHPDMGIV
jgi:phosphate transport system protein